MIIQLLFESPGFNDSFFHFFNLLKFLRFFAKPFKGCADKVGNLVKLGLRRLLEGLAELRWDLAEPILDRVLEVRETESDAF